VFRQTEKAETMCLRKKVRFGDVLGKTHGQMCLGEAKMLGTEAGDALFLDSFLVVSTTCAS
jgi:hypothetical protein